MIFAVGAAAVSAPAQQPVAGAKPADKAADKPDPPRPSTNPFWGAGAYDAPHESFNNYTSGSPGPAAQPMNDASVQDALNRRKNWTMLTPEQIMGVQTPEQIMGIPDKTGEGKLSLEEQFLRRAGRGTAAGRPG
ncbi:MAG TPA: hypothetical protein VGI63_00330, partial [Verrucomicrobiae bacterium]